MRTRNCSKAENIVLISNSPTTGVFALSITSQRPLPTKTDEVTHETIHPSVRHQKELYPKLAQAIDEHPNLIAKLLPLEEELRKNWPYTPTTQQETPDLEKSPGVPDPLKGQHSLGELAHDVAKVTMSVIHKVAGEN